MRRRELRKFNHYLSAMRKATPEPETWAGKFGERDPNTGKYRTQLNNDGIIPTTWIGLSNSRIQGSTTQIDIDTWSDG